MNYHNTNVDYAINEGKAPYTLRMHDQSDYYVIESVTSSTVLHTSTCTPMHLWD